MQLDIVDSLEREYAWTLEILHGEDLPTGTKAVASIGSRPSLKILWSLLTSD